MIYVFFPQFNEACAGRYGIVCSVLLVTGSALPWQQAKTAQATGPKPTIQQLLTNLQKNFRKVSSFHVVVSSLMDDSVNDLPCWHGTGPLDAKYLAFFTGGGVLSGTMLQTTACIGKADYI